MYYSDICGSLLRIQVIFDAMLLKANEMTCMNLLQSDFKATIQDKIIKTQEQLRQQAENENSNLREENFILKNATQQSQPPSSGSSPAAMEDRRSTTPSQPLPLSATSAPAQRETSHRSFSY